MPRKSRILLLLAVGAPSWAFAASPIVDAAGPYSGASGTTVSITASFTGITCSTGALFHWDLNNDGTYDIVDQPENDADASASGLHAHTYSYDTTGFDGPNTRTIRAKVTATACDDGTDTAQITVLNVEPVLESKTAPSSIQEGSSGNYTVVVTDTEAADTHTATWDWADSTADTTVTADHDGSPHDASTTHTYTDEGSYQVTLTVTDDDDGQDSETFIVVVTNVSPDISTSTIPGTGDEGAEIAFTASATDPGADTLTYTWTFGDGQQATGSSVTHTYADQGSFGITLTVSDGDGGSDGASGTIDIANKAPTVAEITGDDSGTEGELWSFGAEVIEPGSADVLSYSWTFGDGSTSTQAAPTHTFADEGTYTVEVTVCDDESACDTVSEQVTVDNVAPQDTLVSGDTSGDEGDELSLSCSASDPGSGDAVDYSWDFSDGGSATGASVTHIFDEQGTYSATCTASDADGGSSSDEQTVFVANVAPSLGGTPSTTVVEGDEYSFQPTVDDPGVADTHTWTLLTGPGGMAIDAGSHEITWVTAWQQLGSHPVALRVTDDEGAFDELEWTIEVTMLDVDVDGMSDGWEADAGLDAAVDDASEDPDGDGRANLLEWTDRTDPLSYDGPGSPGLFAPLDGDEVASAPIELSVTNATSPVGEPLVYQFAVYADSAMTTVVTEGTDVVEGSGMTAWTIDVELDENTWYFWTVAAEDPYTVGDWAVPYSLFYNTTNEAPSAPGLSKPFDGSTVADLTPVLELDPASDPDEDDLLYSFVLTAADGITVLDENLDTDELSWTPDIELTDGTEYCWYAWATDEHSLDGEPSELACFVIDPDNEAPSAPVFSQPVDGAITESATPLVIVGNGVDPEGRDTWVIFELDVDETFATEAYQSATVAANEAGATEWEPSELLEDTWYHVRAMTTDGGATSDWATSRFFVNAENAAPTAPGLFNPADGAAIAVGDSLVVTNATDPEGFGLTYDFVIYDAAGDEVQSVIGVAEGDDETSWTPEVLAPGEYEWTARAVDVDGEPGPWAEPSRAVVILGDEDPDTGAGGQTDDTDVEDKGCSCGGSSPVGGIGSALLGAMALVRRRARRASQGFDD